MITLPTGNMMMREYNYSYLCVIFLLCILNSCTRKSDHYTTHSEIQNIRCVSRNSPEPYIIYCLDALVSKTQYFIDVIDKDPQATEGSMIEILDTLHEEVSALENHIMEGKIPNMLNDADVPANLKGEYRLSVIRSLEGPKQILELTNPDRDTNIKLRNVLEQFLSSLQNIKLNMEAP